MCAGVPIPSEEGGAEVPGPEGARRGEAGQVTAGAAPRLAGSSDGTPDVGLGTVCIFLVQCSMVRG